MTGDPTARSCADSAPSPVLAVCGFSGSGKTTLLEQVIPTLVRRGLRVGVLKHSSHGFTVDKRGKDSDRLFMAGADIIMHGAGETVHRYHREIDDLQGALAALLDDHDLVLVEGHRETDLPKVWLATEKVPGPPEDVPQVFAVLDWGDGRAESLLEIIETRILRRR